MRSYLGVAGHFISESWTPESVMLGCNHVIGRHTADNIVLWYDEITLDFGTSDKVKHVATGWIFRIILSWILYEVI